MYWRWERGVDTHRLNFTSTATQQGHSSIEMICYYLSVFCPVDNSESLLLTVVTVAPKMMECQEPTIIITINKKKYVGNIKMFPSFFIPFSAFQSTFHPSGIYSLSLLDEAFPDRVSPILLCFHPCILY